MFDEQIDWILTNWKIIVACAVPIIAVTLLVIFFPHISIVNWLRKSEKAITLIEAIIGTVILIIAVVGYVYKKAIGEW